MNEYIISGFIKRAHEHGLSTGQAIDLWEKVAIMEDTPPGSPTQGLGRATGLSGVKNIFGKVKNTVMNPKFQDRMSKAPGVVGGIIRGTQGIASDLGRISAGFHAPSAPPPSSGVSSSVGKSVTPANPAPSSTAGNAASLVNSEASRATPLMNDGIAAALKGGLQGGAMSRGAMFQKALGGLMGGSVDALKRTVGDQVSSGVNLPGAELPTQPGLSQLLEFVRGKSRSDPNFNMRDLVADMTGRVPNHMPHLSPPPADGIPTQPGEMGLLDSSGNATKPPIQ